jgi:hypothetical protein
MATFGIAAFHLRMKGGSGMWFRIDLSALVGGIIGFLLMLFVISVFWFPVAIKQVVPFLF